MKIIVGLGNVGTKYSKTRHNSGFLALDEFTRNLEVVDWKEEPKFKAVIAKTSFEGESILLVKPTTFMNNSGESISKILNFYKESSENLIVIYDDIDLPLGTIRVRDKGSAGTHNGMKSVIEHLGTENFDRIRIGIESRGELTHKSIDLADFVLGEFTANEYPTILESLKKAVEELEKLIKN